MEANVIHRFPFLVRQIRPIRHRIQNWGGASLKSLFTGPVLLGNRGILPYLAILQIRSQLGKVVWVKAEISIYWPSIARKPWHTSLFGNFTNKIAQSSLSQLGKVVWVKAEISIYWPSIARYGLKIWETVGYFIRTAVPASVLVGFLEKGMAPYDFFWDGDNEYLGPIHDF
ncbi:hypothetical protein B0H10DRAFT_1952143 [Mycena sp. CBHHK59/15]|nr:hypothetical protein B0H10DRAFT_1952143 [Mycena sp. CBHHK59/15]